MYLFIPPLPGTVLADSQVTPWRKHSMLPYETAGWAGESVLIGESTCGLVGGGGSDRTPYQTSQRFMHPSRDIQQKATVFITLNGRSIPEAAAGSVLSVDITGGQNRRTARRLSPGPSSLKGHSSCRTEGAAGPSV